MTAHSDHLDPHHIFAAWGSGTARYWKTRAEVFERARPRPDDFHGRATSADLAEQWDRLTDKANACRARAAIADKYGPTAADRAMIAGVAEALLVAA